MLDDTTRAMYPFEGKTLDRGGLRYHYLDEGQGDPVVMLHGNPSWSFYYRNLVMALKDGHRCIVPDHIGMGLSDKPGDDRYTYTLESRVDDLEALLDHLGLTDNLTLVVHDWGGMIGFAFASRHPERIKRLVVLNTSAFLLPETKPFPLPLWMARDTALGAWLVRGVNAFAGAASFVGCTEHPMPTELRNAYIAPYDNWDNRIATLRFVQDIPLKPGDRAYDLVKSVQDGLERFAGIPMLICWGDKDFVFDHHFLAEWERRFPNAEVHRFPKAGHYVLEDARESVIPLIREFLRTYKV
ncbi:MAG: alpha/beta fold hydrolase [Candidatus Sericytochromatia bacterium]